MPVNHVLLETIELSQSAASITFDNIPQTGYTDLKISMSMRSTGNLGSPNTFFDITTVALNGSTSISQQQAYTNGATVYAGTGATLQIHCVGSGATANTFGNAEMYIANYTTSSNKAINVDLVTENNGSNAIDMIVSGLWASSSAVSSIALSVYSGSFVAGSTFSIYGVAGTGTTPTVGPKANGGNIVANDGTYWYHAFLASGTFTPTVALTSDVLVVAGGGGGGGSGPGGGAGGLLSFTSQSLSTTSYTCTVGSGGAAGYTATQAGFRGSNGTDSQFGALTLVKGGGGAGGNDNPGQQDGLNGGSGGGGGSAGATIGTGGSATSGQGNAGGSGSTDNNTYRYVGGGGGAGAAGGSGTTSANGAGGVGATSALITAMGNATSTGQLVSSNRYFAGGSGATVAGYGGGGTQTVAGTANTGGGGGGSAFTSGSTPVYGGAGGSGIIIIRYAMA